MRLRLRPGRNSLNTSSAPSKRIFQGLNNAQRFPTNATKKAIPTHHTIQTKMGAKFDEGVCSPTRPAAITSPKTKTDRSFKGNRMGLVRTSRSARSRKRLYRQ